MALYRAVSTLTTVPTSPLLNLLAAQSSFGHYWQKITDRTFSGVYHANTFDLAMMIPYFIVLFILALYGLHRYWLVYDYYAYSKNVPAAPPPVTEWPQRHHSACRSYNERYVIERLVEAVSRFDYPPNCSTSRCSTIPPTKPSEVARDCVERHRRARHAHRLYPSHQSRRLQSRRAGKWLENRAGRIRRHFRRGLHAPADFLRRTIPYF